MKNTEVYVSEQAQRNISEIVEWYSRKSDGLGEIFFQILVETIKILGIFPNMYSIAFDDVHEIVMRKFPYSIYYKVYNDKIVISKVKHHRLE